MSPDQALVPTTGATAPHGAGEVLLPHLGDQVRCDRLSL